MILVRALQPLAGGFPGVSRLSGRDWGGSRPFDRASVRLPILLAQPAGKLALQAFSDLENGLIGRACHAINAGVSDYARGIYFFSSVT